MTCPGVWQTQRECSDLKKNTDEAEDECCLLSTRASSIPKPFIILNKRLDSQCYYAFSVLAVFWGFFFFSQR